MIIAAICITILLVSVAGASWRVGKSSSDQPQQVRVLHFMLYFWPLVFIQLIVVAIGYSLLSG